MLPAKPKTKIHVYSVAWNEEALLPYYLRHYRHVEKIYLFDNESTDKTVEIAKAAPNTEVRPLEWKVYHLNSLGEKIYDPSPIWQEVLTNFKNNIWKQSRGVADWVIVCDVDELLYHPSIVSYLNNCKAKGVTIPNVAGYQMVSDHFPTTNQQIYTEINKGHPDPLWFNKCIIFNPNIDEINFNNGSHKCKPVGRVKYSATSECKLLHYKFLGWEYVKARWYQLRDRRSFENPNYSQHWKWPEEKLRAKYDDLMDEAIQVV